MLERPSSNSCLVRGLAVCCRRFLFYSCRPPSRAVTDLLFLRAGSRLSKILSVFVVSLTCSILFEGDPRSTESTASVSYASLNKVSPVAI